MRLTAWLLRKKMPHGHIWTGKHRMFRKVHEECGQRMLKQLEIEEQNMLYLRHPYLTPEQSSGHAKALKKDEQSWIATLNKQRLTFKDHMYVVDHLEHLKVNDAWE